jgi:hypothetical protein
MLLSLSQLLSPLDSSIVANIVTVIVTRVPDAALVYPVAVKAGYIFSPGNNSRPIRVDSAPTTGSIKANTSLDDGCFKIL